MFTRQTATRTEWQVKYETQWGPRTEYRSTEDAARAFAATVENVTSIELVTRLLDY